MSNCMNYAIHLLHLKIGSTTKEEAIYHLNHVRDIISKVKKENNNNGKRTPQWFLIESELKIKQLEKEISILS
jgi:hypothetical protein